MFSIGHTVAFPHSAIFECDILEGDQEAGGQSGRPKDETMDNILTEKRLSNSAYSHIIHAPIERVDIAGWLFSMSEAEYCRCCPPDHISGASTTTDDGKKMAVNVEMIGKTLMIQHFVAEIATLRFAEWSRLQTHSRQTAARGYK